MIMFGSMPDAPLAVAGRGDERRSRFLALSDVDAYQYLNNDKR